MDEKRNEIILFENQGVKLEVNLKDETVWLTQEQMAKLFGKAKSTINEHIKNVYKEGELVENETMTKFGNSEFADKPTNYYNLDMIISIGYRVKSQNGILFRKWATNVLKDYIKKEDIVIEKPKMREMGDYALPCFTYSKVLKKSPNDIANTIKEKLCNYEINVVNGYANVFINKKEFSKNILDKIALEKEEFGSSKIGQSKTVVIEYSSPNIAKPFGVGHLRSTVIGEALKNICIKTGYNVYTINYLGDYGTQFGKLIYAYKTWGNAEAIKENPIQELKRVYVKFHELDFL